MYYASLTSHASGHTVHQFCDTLIKSFHLYKVKLQHPKFQEGIIQVVINIGKLNFYKADKDETFLVYSVINKEDVLFKYQA